MTSNSVVEFINGADDGNIGSKGVLGKEYKAPGAVFHSLPTKLTVEVRFLENVGDSIGSSNIASGSGGFLTG